MYNESSGTCVSMSLFLPLPLRPMPAPLLERVEGTKPTSLKDDLRPWIARSCSSCIERGANVTQGGLMTARLDERLREVLPPGPKKRWKKPADRLVDAAGTCSFLSLSIARLSNVAKASA